MDAQEFEKFVTAALGDADGNPVPIGRTILTYLSGPNNLLDLVVKRLQGGEMEPADAARLGELDASLGRMAKRLAAPANLAEGVAPNSFSLRDISPDEIFKQATKALTSNLQKLLQEFMKWLISGETKFFASFLEGTFKLLIEFAHTIIRALVGPCEATAQGIADALGELVEAVVKVLIDGFSELAKALPVSLWAGPLDSLGAVLGLKTLLTDLKSIDQIQERIKAVGNSLAELIGLLAAPNGASGSGQAGFGALSKAIQGLSDGLADLLSGKENNPSKALTTLLKDVFVPLIIPTGLIRDLFRNAGQGRLWAWAELPGGLPIGVLNRWLNDDSTYRDGKATAVERQFRVRMVAAVDAYFRGQNDTRTRPFAEGVPLSRSDEGDSAQALSEAITVVVGTAVQYAFEPECFPLAEIDLDGIEDLGLRFSLAISLQIRVAIRVSIGLLLRGWWIFTIGNIVLIELIAVFFSVFFSAILEALLRNLTWSLQVTSCYPRALFGDAPAEGPTPLKPAQSFPPLQLSLGGRELVYYWPSAETVAETGNPVDRLWYVATVRAAGLKLPSGYPVLYGKESEQWQVLAGLLRDFGAYLDVCYRTFRVDSRFPAVVPGDEVRITRAEVRAGRLTVWATTSAAFEEPQPVLRAYFCCHVVPLRPGRYAGEAYQLDLALDAAPACLEVTVLSNRGGVARRRVVGRWVKSGSTADFLDFLQGFKAMANGMERDADHEGSEPGAPREYATEYVDVKGHAEAILPYALEAIRTLGAGSAVAVGKEGIQLTLPVLSLHYLAPLIERYGQQLITETQSGTHPTTDETVSLKFYPPVVPVNVKTRSLKPVVDSLRICPPDMKVEWIELDGGRSVLVVAGPRSTAREKFYKETILPNLMALATQLAADPDLGIP